LLIRASRNIIGEMKKGKTKPSSKNPTIDVSHVAKLANLPLSDTELKKFERQLNETLTYIENLKEIDTRNVEPAANVTGLENIVREDTAAPSISQEEALKNGKSTYNGFFKVKAILED